jgi:hypothetical protein
LSSPPFRASLGRAGCFAVRPVFGDLASTSGSLVIGAAFVMCLVRSGFCHAHLFQKNLGHHMTIPYVIFDCAKHVITVYKKLLWQDPGVLPGPRSMAESKQG